MIKRLALLSPFALLALPSGAVARPDDYAEGQVWQYATRPQDHGSLLKIQKIEIDDGRPVYHVSLIGVHFANAQAPEVLSHLPVSAETLDASVIRRVASAKAFPNISADEDIAEWHAMHGGVLTVPLAQALNDVDGMLSRRL